MLVNNFASQCHLCEVLLAGEAMAREHRPLGRVLRPFLPAGSGPGPDAEALLPALLPAHEEVGAAPSPQAPWQHLVERELWMPPPWQRPPLPGRGVAPWARAAMAWSADGVTAGGDMA